MLIARRKGFATSISIVLSFLASVALFNYPISLAFCVGSSIVLAATYMYNAPAPSAQIPRTAIGVDPGSPISQSAPILGEPERPSRTSSFVNLLGLGSGSNASSRKPSATDLRSSFGSLPGGHGGHGGHGGPGTFTQVTPVSVSSALNGHGAYPGSASTVNSTPGTPYLSSSSANQSSNSLYDKRGVSPISTNVGVSRPRSPNGHR